MDKELEESCKFDYILYVKVSEGQTLVEDMIISGGRGCKISGEINGTALFSTNVEVFYNPKDYKCCLDEFYLSQKGASYIISGVNKIIQNISEKIGKEIKILELRTFLAI